MDNNQVQGGGIRNWINKHKILTVILLLLVIGAINSASKKSTSDTNQQAAAPQSANQTPKSPEEKLEDSFKTSIAKDSSRFSYIKTEFNKDNHIVIHVQTKDIWNKESLMRTSGELSSNLFQNAYGSQTPVADAIVWYYGDTTDKYGKKENKVILSYAMGKPTYDKVSWNNFNKANLCEFLRAEQTDEAFENACALLVNIN